jgi:trk system potassium uptake protein TrkH
MSWSPAKTLVLFFVTLIALATAFLSLPFAIREGQEFSLLSNLFSAVSAVCVTGLTVADIGTHYTLFGQTVILIAAQLGGMGYMFVSTLGAVILGKMTLRDRRILGGIFDINSFGDVKKVLKKAVFFCLAIEFIGFIVLTLAFLRDFSFGTAAYLGIFYSVISFCNAGFSVFNNSLIPYSGDPLVLAPLFVLIVLGGLGFFVLVDIYDTYKYKHTHFLVQTKIVLVASAVILTLGFLVLLFYEKIDFVNALFLSASLRTAGFNSVDMSSFTSVGKFIFTVFMAIGAAPSSLAGGLKVTTIVVVLVFIKSFLKSQDDVTIFKRTLSPESVKKAVLGFILASCTLGILALSLLWLEPNIRPIDLIFEAVSAFSNAGVSLGVSDRLSNAGKIIDILAMFVGRIGVITVLLLAVGNTNKSHTAKYPRAEIFVG